MSVIAEAVRHLIAAGVTGDALVTAIADMESAQKPARSSAAIRQARYRENRRNALRNVDNERNNVTPNHEPYIARASAPVCSNDFSNEKSKLDTPLPTVGTPAKKTSGKSGTLSNGPSPKEILSEVLTPETAADVVAHRKALRKPLTPRAARELAKSLSASGDAERAAATMIERGWQGYRADWVGGSPNARAGPSQGGGWAKQLVKLEQNAREQPTESGGTVEAIPWLSERKDEGRRADDAHDGGVSRNPVELLVGNSFRRM